MASTSVTHFQVSATSEKGNRLVRTVVPGDDEIGVRQMSA